MPAVLFVPLNFLQMTFCSHTVTELALLQHWLHYPAGEDDCSFWLGKHLAQKHHQPPLGAPTPEPVPALRGCQPQVHYQKHLPTCQVTENPFLPFPLFLLSHSIQLDLHMVHSRSTLQAVTGTQRAWRHIGRSPSPNSSMRQAQMYFPVFVQPVLKNLQRRSPACPEALLQYFTSSLLGKFS